MITILVLHTYLSMFSYSFTDAHWDGVSCPTSVSVSIGTRAKVTSETTKAEPLLCSKDFGPKFLFFEILIDEISGDLSIGLAVKAK